MPTARLFLRLRLRWTRKGQRDGDTVDDGDRLPEPPADLADRTLPLRTRPAGGQFVRIHRARDGAIWFGWNDVSATFRPPINRFDAPDRSYGVLHMALSRDGAFAESVGRKPRSVRTDEELAKLRLSTLALVRPVRLVDLHGGAAVGALGATGVIGVGPQSLARRWAERLQAHPARPDGIEYRCRHNSDELAAALFDRVAGGTLTQMGVVDVTSDQPLVVCYEIAPPNLDCSALTSVPGTSSMTTVTGRSRKPFNTANVVRLLSIGHIIAL